MNSRTTARAWAAAFAARVAVALGALLIFAVLSLPALAQDGARIAALSKESAEAFSAYIQETTQAHRRPDYSKPPVAQYLQQILDADAFAALPPIQGSDVTWLLDWYGSVSQTYKKLLYFGVTNDSDLKSAVTLNVAEAEDQIIRAMALQVRMGSRLVSAMPLFLATLPPEAATRTEIRKAGMQKAQRALIETVSGAVISVAGPMRPGNALLLVAALRDTAPVWAPYATANERAGLLRLLKQGSTANAYPGVVDALTSASSTVSSIKD